ALHISDIFGVPHQMLFDAARRQSPAIEVPLWSGLRLNALALARSQEVDAGSGGFRTSEQAPLKDVETALIRKAVDDARGNVAQAARLLGISRATVYRKLSHGKRH
ncbi:MAG: helix-turn-helix domain-containing protein, partial [Rhodoferax sp.]